MSSLWPGTGGPAIDYISAPPQKAWLNAAQRELVILGSTGSIGRSAIEVARAYPDFLRIRGLACGRNAELLARQACEFRPPYLACQDEATAQNLARRLPAGYRPEILVGREGYAVMASLPEARAVLSAQAGAAGLCATLAAALSGKVVCLANKESLVMAGGLLRRICAASGAAMLPVDSEHNAIFQCLAGRGQEVSSLVLTASGGPFRGKSRQELAHVGPQEALRHPTWSMGAKISIDSATMMNKGLEIIEACHLYGVGQNFVRVLVHPQSIVHSLVEFADNSMLAQLACPDMRLPIGSCLLWPGALPGMDDRLDLAAVGSLTFFEADTETFACPDLARKAFDMGDAACIALNAANEAAVGLFLDGRVAFTGMAALIDGAVTALGGETVDCGLPPGPWPNVPALALALTDALDALDSRARQFVQEQAC